MDWRVFVVAAFLLPLLVIALWALIANVSGTKRKSGPSAAGSEDVSKYLPGAWTDEFEELDDTTWQVEESWHGGGNNELQEYVKDAVVTGADGLRITAKRQQSPHGKPFVSGKLVAKKGLKRGTVTFRAVLPKGAGVWPALWLLPQQIAHAPGASLPASSCWPKCGEIDVMELRGRTPTVAIQTIHYFVEAQGGWKYTTNEYAPGPSFADGNEHEFKASWDKTRLTFSVDGKATRELAFAEIFVNDVENPFNKDTTFVPILNLAIGGGFDNGAAPDPQADGSEWTMLVKSVSVQPLDESSQNDGGKSTDVKAGARRRVSSGQSGRARTGAARAGARRGGGRVTGGTRGGSARGGGVRGGAQARRRQQGARASTTRRKKTFARKKRKV